jgi:hypothetical protein
VRAANGDWRKRFKIHGRELSQITAPVTRHMDFNYALRNHCCGKKKFVPSRRFRGLILPMNIQVAVLCDAATDDNGKLNLLGAFDTIFAPLMPAVHPQCAVALRATFLPGDEGTRKLSLNFINADGHSIMQAIELPVPVTLPDDAHFLTRNFIINIQQLKFADAGLYSVDVRVDGETQASIPLLVKLVERPVA